MPATYALQFDYVCAFAGCRTHPPDADETVFLKIVLAKPKAFGGGVEVDVVIHHEAAA